MSEAAFDELSGAPRFTHTWRWGDYFLGVTSTTRSLYAASGDVAHFDLEHRWTRARFAGRTYLRGLDGTVLERFGGADGADERKDPLPVHEAVVGLVAQARQAGAEGSELPAPTLAQLQAEPGRFAAVYQPVGIAPPDRYRSLIIQLTHGCAFNGCLYCSLYKGQRFRAVGPDELRGHVRRVVEFVGSGVHERHGLFLGEANALAAPFPTLHKAFGVLHEELPLLAGDVASFVDAFARYRSVAELRALRGLGLTRVFVGAESGDPTTLQSLGKPTSAAAMRALVDELKGAQLSVGLIFLAGLGPAHEAASAELVASLPLDSGDVVYVSPLVLGPGGALAQALAARGVAPTPRSAAEEAARLTQAFAGRAKVGRYDVRRWLYG